MLNQNSDLPGKDLSMRARITPLWGWTPRYCSGMKKATTSNPSSVTKPMLKTLVEQQKATMAKQKVEEKPAADYQDNGGGYNTNYVIPQK